MSGSIQILLVEDNELDVRMILKSAQKTKLRNSISAVNDGQAALKKLEKCDEENLPDLILLDLSLPGITGLELLKIVKDDERFRAIPVVILTSSAAKSDVKQAYDAYASAFITKPIEVGGFAEIVLAIDDFFFDIVSLPSPSQ